MAAVPSSSRTRAIPLISLFTRPPHPQTGKLCSGYLANATSILGSRFTPQSLPDESSPSRPISVDQVPNASKSRGGPKALRAFAHTLRYARSL
ncbi:hypothetical protein PM082_004585 [Marasmius tenuissimus]|nr:hypothetical protein PM082_004585 [Marasmius tenuissimus]